VVVVPLYVDARGEPEFSAIDAATREIGRGPQPGTLVTYETTLPVGGSTCAEIRPRRSCVPLARRTG
jgi:UDP-N-acetyl-D-mannosaminuronate dehydrogenase